PGRLAAKAHAGDARGSSLPRRPGLGLRDRLAEHCACRSDRENAALREARRRLRLGRRPAVAEIRRLPPRARALAAAHDVQRRAARERRAVRSLGFRPEGPLGMNARLRMPATYDDLLAVPD